MSANDFDFEDITSSGGATRKELEYDYELSDNVVDDLVKYTRSKTVKNEQQFVLTTLGYISGFMENPKHFISGVLIGTAGSGKSHLQNTVEELFPEDYLYQATSGTDKSIIYDDDWDDAFIASLDELQKPSDEIIEILKSLHGGEDEEFRYKITGDGRGADRDVDEIVRSAVPYWFLYAQYEPDFEMWDRLLKVPVHESEEKNEGVVETQWDHSFIEFTGGDDDTASYMYDFEDGEYALRDHIREMPKDVWVKIPAGEEEFGWDAVQYAKPIFDIQRSETNRVSSMVANLVRASALLNYENRETKRIKVRNEGVKEAIIAEPQDLANVLSCRDVLLATTHQLDRKRRAICLAIDEVGGDENAAPIKHPDDTEQNPLSIMGYLQVTNASFVKKSQIIQMLGDLQENYLVEKLEGAGTNGKNLYKFTSWQNLGMLNVDEDSFKSVFADCHDPFSEQTFIDRAREMNAELRPSVEDFMSDAEISSGSDTDDGQTTLTDEPKMEVDLSPHEEQVRSMLKESVDGVTIDGLDEREPTIRELIGLVPLGEEEQDIDVAGTILDPEHEVWTYGPDDWVKTTQDAEKQVEKAMRKLTIEGVFKTSTTKSRGGQPIQMKVSVKDVE